MAESASASQAQFEVTERRLRPLYGECVIQSETNVFHNFVLLNYIKSNTITRCINSIIKVDAVHTCMLGACGITVPRVYLV